MEIEYILYHVLIATSPESEKYIICKQYTSAQCLNNSAKS